MVKLGEVEFLVKFDTVSKTFADTLKEAIGDEDLFNTEDIEDQLNKIEGHLGVLVTPFSGNRMVDIVKSEGYLEQLKDPAFKAKKIETIASHKTLLDKFGIEEPTGSPEAKEQAEEKFDAFSRDMADFIKMTMSSELSYIKNFATLQDIIGLLTVSTEGNLAYLMEKIMDKMKMETEIDKALFKWLDKDMEVKIGKTQRMWDQLLKDVMPTDEEGEEIEPEVFVETYQDFLDLLGEKLEGKENLETLREEILFGDPKKVSAELKELMDEIMETTGFKKGLQVPRIFRKGLEEAQEMEKGELFGKKLNNIKNDLKFIVEDVDKVGDIIERMGGSLSEEEKANLVDRAINAIEQYGWYYFFGESKVFGSERKVSEEKKRLGPGAGTEMLSAAQYGKEFSLFTEIASSQIPIEKVIEEMAENKPEQMVKMLEGNQLLLESMYNYMKGMEDDIVENLSDEMVGKFEEEMDKLSVLFGG